jgi:ferredoxin
MDLAVTIFLAACGFVLFASLSAFSVQSLREREPRAAGLAGGLALGGALPILAAWLLPTLWKLGLAGLFLAAGLALLILFFLPIGRVERGQDVPRVRVDERDIMFARRRLVPGSPEYESYYTLRPEHKAVDDTIRALPGLLSPQARLAHPLHFAAADASFELSEALHGDVDGRVAADILPVDAAAITPYIKDLARFYGAQAVGITELQPYHVYSHIGRGRGTYGAPITLEHRYAIALTVAMDYAMIGTAPQAPTMMETAKEYARVAQAAVQLAHSIRSLGYPALAHIDGNYRVIAPLVARDAGLGDIGRMGLLMTPDLGPRVRLAVVTTDLPLLVDKRDQGTAVLDFCRICKKCAENCPSRAIPFDDRQEIAGALRWRIDSIRCFRYWNVIGTDCGRCLAVCPYSHPDNAGHNLVRRAIRRSGFARRAALWMDDLFYGRKPVPRPAPGWTAIEPPS